METGNGSIGKSGSAALLTSATIEKSGFGPRHNTRKRLRLPRNGMRTLPFTRLTMSASRRCSSTTNSTPWTAEPPSTAGSRSMTASSSPSAPAARRSSTSATSPTLPTRPTSASACPVATAVCSSVLAAPALATTPTRSTTPASATATWSSASRTTTGRS